MRMCLPPAPLTPLSRYGIGRRINVYRRL